MLVELTLHNLQNTVIVLGKVPWESLSRPRPAKDNNANPKSVRSAIKEALHAPEQSSSMGGASTCAPRGGGLGGVYRGNIWWGTMLQHLRTGRRILARTVYAHAYRDHPEEFLFFFFGYRVLCRYCTVYQCALPLIGTG